MSPLGTRALFVASAHSNIFVRIAPKILCGSCPNSSPPSADDSVWHKATKAKQFAFYMNVSTFMCLCALARNRTLHVQYPDRIFCSLSLCSAPKAARSGFDSSHKVSQTLLRCHTSLRSFVPSRGIEPRLRDPQSRVLSIKLRGRTQVTTMRRHHYTNSFTFLPPSTEKVNAFGVKSKTEPLHDVDDEWFRMVLFG